MSVTPIYAPNGFVKVRFLCQQVTQEDFDKWCAPNSSYKLIKKEGTLRHTSYLVLSKVSDTKEFEDQYLAKKGKFLCDKCRDSAVWHDENSKWHYCDCEFGKLTKKIWK
jgi:hypothetical protein